MQIARILEHGVLQSQSVRRDEERMELAAAGRAVRADLVIEADDLVAIVSAEEHEITGVGLPHESLDGAGELWLRTIRLQRVRAAHPRDLAVDDQGAPLCALDPYTVAIDGANETDARMREQLRVEARAPSLARDLAVGQTFRDVGVIHERQRRTVRHDHVMALVDPILLRQNQLAHAVVPAHPVPDAPQRTPHGATSRRRALRPRL